MFKKTKNIIIILAHIALASTLAAIVLFSSRISTLVFILIGIFGLITLFLKCKDCPAFQIEGTYEENSSSDIIGSFMLGKNYYKVDKQMFTMIILYIAFLLTILKIIGVVTIKYFSFYSKKN